MTDSTTAGMDSLPARGPLDGYREVFAALPAAEVQLAVLPLARHFNLRVDPAGAGGAAVAGVLGCDLPTASTWAETPGGTVVWLGPDEWLILDPTGQPDLEHRLRAAVLERGGAVVEQSGQRTSLLVTGNAAGLLAKGTAIDLHPTSFPRGSAVQSFLGQTVVVLLARDDSAAEVEVLVRSSFARYLAEWLLDGVSDPLATA